MSQASFHIIGDLLEREVYNLGPALSAVNITMFEGTGLKEWLHKEIHLRTLRPFLLRTAFCPLGLWWMGVAIHMFVSASESVSTTLRALFFGGVTWQLAFTTHHFSIFTIWPKA